MMMMRCVLCWLGELHITQTHLHQKIFNETWEKFIEEFLKLECNNNNLPPPPPPMPSTADPPPSTHTATTTLISSVLLAELGTLESVA